MSGSSAFTVSCLFHTRLVAAHRALSDAMLQSLPLKAALEVSAAPCWEEPKGGWASEQTAETHKTHGELSPMGDDSVSFELWVRRKAALNNITGEAGVI